MKKTPKSFSEVTVTNIDKQIDGQKKHYKAIKGRTPANNIRRERIRDTIERYRDRRNALTGNPKSEPIESIVYEEVKKPVVTTTPKGHGYHDVHVDGVHQPHLTVAIDNRSNGNYQYGGKSYSLYNKGKRHSGGTLAQIKDKIAHSIYASRKKKAEMSEAKDMKDIDFDDLRNVNYVPGQDKLIKRAAIKRKRADVEHEAVSADKVPQAYIDVKGRQRVRMVPADREIVKESKAEYAMMAYTEKKAVKDAKASGVGNMSRSEKEKWIDAYIQKNKIPSGALGSAVYSGVMKVKDHTKKITEKNAYAIGMAQAMKSEKDKPPLKKSTVMKAHKIAKAVQKEDVAPQAAKNRRAKVVANLDRDMLNIKGISDVESHSGHKAGYDSSIKAMKKAASSLKNSKYASDMKEANEFSHLSDDEVRSKLEKHTSARNKASGGVNSAAHVYHSDMAKKARKELEYRVEKGLGLRKESLEEYLKESPYADKIAELQSKLSNSSPENRDHIESMLQDLRRKNRNWVNRKRGISEEIIDEALNVQQRMKRAISLRKNKAKLAMGRRRNASRIADKDRLLKRANRKARGLILKRLTKGIDKSELSPARKAELEKRLDKMKPRIEKIARKILPQVRKDEIRKKRGGDEAPTKSTAVL